MLLKSALLAAILSCAPVWAADPDRGDLAQTLAVIMTFDQEYSAVSLATMERELESIMSCCRLNIEWRILSDETSKESFDSLVVTHFRGGCRNETPRWRQRTTHVLGFTHISEGEILPFSEVDCDKVRDIIAPRLAHESRSRGEQLLGRAVGRVLAHELYHILARTKRHGDGGIAKPVLTPGDLLGGQLSFEPVQTEGIFRSMRRAIGGVSHSAFLAK